MKRNRFWLRDSCSVQQQPFSMTLDRFSRFSQGIFKRLSRAETPRQIWDGNAIVTLRIFMNNNRILHVCHESSPIK